MESRIKGVADFIGSLPPQSFPTPKVVALTKWEVTFVTRPWQVRFVPSDAPELGTMWGIQARGRTVREVDRDLHSRGCESGVIYVASDIPTLEQLHTLLHELGHLLCDPVSQWADNGATAEEAAERFALEILRQWGLEPQLPELNQDVYLLEHRGRSEKPHEPTVQRAVKKALDKFTPKEEWENER